MTRFLLAAGVAALAISAPASAKPDGERGGGHSAHQTSGGGGQKANRGGGGQRAQAQRQGGGQMRAARIEQRGGGEARQFRLAQQEQRRASRIERRSDDRQAMRAERRNDDRRLARAERRDDRRVARVERRDDRRIANVQRREDRIDRREIREARVANRIQNRDVVRTRDWNDRDRWANARGLVNGCPPGLAMKDNGCLPPGQARKLIGQVIPASYRDRALPLGLRDIYRDTDDYYYRYGDGYVYRVDRQSNLVNSLLPLIAGGYGVGSMFPSSYMNSYVPNYYSSFYPDSPYMNYRYANGYVYGIDPNSGYIENVIPMYDYGYGVGQMLPSSYSYYNVPYQYRDMYYDNDDYYYRYAPGSIYQVDRGTNLITALAALLSPGFAVGQPLPMGYDAYNVPYAYRSQYYDTSDAWYRYNNGYIYQVDPTTRLVTEIIRAIV